MLATRRVDQTSIGRFTVTLTNKNLVLLGTNKPKPKESTKENIVLTAESGKLRVSDLPRDQEPDPPPGNKFSIILMGLRFSEKKGKPDVGRMTSIFWETSAEPRVRPVVPGASPW